MTELTEILNGETDASVFTGRAIEMRCLLPSVERAIGQLAREGGREDAIQQLVEGCEALEYAAGLLDTIAAGMDQ